jgi:hypothetical protein
MEMVAIRNVRLLWGYFFLVAHWGHPCGLDDEHLRVPMKMSGATLAGRPCQCPAVGHFAFWDKGTVHASQFQLPLLCFKMGHMSWDA